MSFNLRPRMLPKYRLATVVLLVLSLGLALALVLTVDGDQLRGWSDGVRHWFTSVDRKATARAGLQAAQQRLAARQADLDRAMRALVEALDQPGEPASAQRLGATAGRAALALALAQADVAGWQTALGMASTPPTTLDVEAAVTQVSAAGSTWGEQVQQTVARAQAAASDAVARAQAELSDLRRQTNEQSRSAQEELAAARREVAHLSGELEEARRAVAQAGAQVQAARHEAELARQLALARPNGSSDAPSPGPATQVVNPIMVAPPAATPAPAGNRDDWNRLEMLLETRRWRMDREHVTAILGEPTLVHRSGTNTMLIYQSPLGQGIVQLRDGQVTGVSPPPFNR
jgi:hypothetical protein